MMIFCCNSWSQRPIRAAVGSGVSCLSELRQKLCSHGSLDLTWSSLIGSTELSETKQVKTKCNKKVKVFPAEWTLVERQSEAVQLKMQNHKNICYADELTNIDMILFPYNWFISQIFDEGHFIIFLKQCWEALDVFWLNESFTPSTFPCVGDLWTQR